ncbi:ATP-binding protein [Gottfriedia sp. NPDC056225]|uniref:ATP-binding protein n=1 Tax=Gottfriedia sp. NPDC056225 TaxID=3345751 RepID=UPI0035D7C830
MEIDQINEEKYILLPSGIKAIKANYRTDEKISKYRDNPLITALPKIMSEYDAFEFMSHYPSIEQNLSEFHDNERFHSLTSVKSFFHVGKLHLNLEMTFSRFLRDSYVGRNPLDKDHATNFHILHSQLNAGEELYLPPNSLSEATSFSLIGYSGMGKSTAIERILQYYPQLIIHPAPVGTTQIVWLKLDCPHDGSMKTLCVSFFDQIDQLLGTTFLKQYKRTSVSTMVTGIAKIAKTYCIGAIIIDELQHLIRPNKTSEMLMNFLVTLVNVVGVGVMVIGTMKAKQVLQLDFRIARRSIGKVWKPLPFSEEWLTFTNELWDYQWTKEFIPHDNELSEVLYDCSQGITDLAVKIFTVAQGRAIIHKRKGISEKLMRQVVNEDLAMIKPMLKALRSGNPKAIMKYEDLYSIDLEEQLEVMSTSLDKNSLIEEHRLRAKEKRINQISLEEKVLTAVIALGKNEKKAKKVFDQLIKLDPQADETTLLVGVLQKIDEEDVIIKRTKKEQAEKEGLKVLLPIAEQAKKEKRLTYDLLKEAGYIKDPLQEFIL